MTGATALLCEMLDCGTLDLKMLNDVTLDWADVLFYITPDNLEDLSFNSVLRAIIHLGVDTSFKYAIEEHIEEAEISMNEEALRALRALNPDEDIEYYTNYLDTHIYFSSPETKEQYEMLLGAEPFEEFCELTGLEIER